MAHKSEWNKICGIKKGETCHNCLHRISIAEDKEKIMVRCKPKFAKEERIIVFNRKTSPNPYCGSYSKGDKE